MFRSVQFFASVAAVMIVASAASATLVVADFNDLVSGGDLKGKTGGTGFEVAAWAGSSTAVDVIAGDLSAPASTHYNVTQSAGTAKMVQTNTSASPPADRANHRGLQAPLTDEVWGSFIISVPDANGKAGIGFNVTDTGFSSLSATQSLLVEGSDLVYRPTSTQVEWVRTTGVVPVNQPVLVVFRVIYAANNPNKGVSVWINPDLIQPLSTPTLFSSMIGNGNINRLSIGGFASGQIDAVRLSDDDDALTDVTGQPMVVPEPATLGLSLIGGLLFLPRRHGQR